MPILRQAAATLCFVAVTACTPTAFSCEVSQEAYDAVELGMRLDEVVDIVGCPGEDLTKEKFPGRDARYIEWAGNGIEIADMWVTIRDDVVGGKGLGIFAD